MQPRIPDTQELVLIGGGHSHAIALQMLGMNPIPGVRLTLVTNVSHTPYSGMLPGYVAGLYSFDECHIDLRPLANFAQAQIIVQEAIALDPVHRWVKFADRPPLPYDLLSIDIGSTPAIVNVPGAATYTIPVKPIAQFLHYWDALVDEVARSPQRPLSLGIVGGGAGGVELALSINARLRSLYQQAGQSPQNLTIHLFHRGAELLPERSAWVRRQMLTALTQRGIHVHLDASVTAVEPKAVQCESGLRVECDRVFWVTQAGAADWIRASGLATDDRGFIQVNDCLQSVSHPEVFAAGDIATMIHHPRPKAGVFAVRQGQPLADNLRRAALGQSLRPFTPQKNYLILIGTGDRQALASRGGLGFGPHPWLWQWKDSIDRKFMDRFTNLQPMPMNSPTQSSADAPVPMRCSGCGAKVGQSVLARSLQRLQPDLETLHHENVVVGLEQPDDAAVIQVPPGLLMVQTVDYFPTLINDPFVFGQIAANHCLNDLFAMGASPQSALAIATLQPASEAIQENTLYQLLVGALTRLKEVGAALVGGHTTEGPECVFGLVCNGVVERDRLWSSGGMERGQALILTKAIGTGVLFAADMQLKAKGRWIDSAVASMLQSNYKASILLRQYGATACTDVTGFGLVGHLLDLVRASQVSVDLDLESIAVLDGAAEVLRQGITSSLYPQNAKRSGAIANLAEISTHPLFPLLFDPQTSGGLLASIPATQAQTCLQALQESGYRDSRIIGRVEIARESTIPIRIH